APASIPIMMAETAEELSKRPEIRKELDRATGQKRHEKIETEGGYKFWFVVYAVVLAICAVIYFAAGAKLIPLPDSGVAIAQRIPRDPQHDRDQCCAAQDSLSNSNTRIRQRNEFCAGAFRLRTWSDRGR